MQQVFVNEYLKTSNATAAAKSAGYSEKTAYVQGSRLLRNPAIQALIAKRRAKYDIQADRVLAEIAKIGFANIADYIVITKDGKAEIDLSACTTEQLAAISEIRTDVAAGGSGDGVRQRVDRITLKMHGKLDALTLLARNLKLLTDKVELSTTDELAERMARARRSTGGYLDVKNEPGGVDEDDLQP